LAQWLSSASSFARIFSDVALLTSPRLEQISKERSIERDVLTEFYEEYQVSVSPKPTWWCCGQHRLHDPAQMIRVILRGTSYR
jgi:hypothetical protein